MAYSSFDLDLLNLQQLKDLAKYHGLEPIGNPGYRRSWVIPLQSFDKIALQQMESGEGIKAPSSRAIDSLIDLIAGMGETTAEQKALIQIIVERQSYKLGMQNMDDHRQRSLVRLHLAQQKIKEALALLVSI